MSPKKRQTPRYPRLDPEQRRLSRLYEPLMLLHVLDPTGERRIIPESLQDVDVSSMHRTDLRRLFLKQLAYVCDDVPGGDTVTAMLLEAQPSCVTLWVTANTRVADRTYAFLETILSSLRPVIPGAIQSLNNDVEIKLGRACIEFNRKRLKMYAQHIKPLIERCLDGLRGSVAEADESVSRFLRSLDSFRADIPKLCEFAYRNRSCRDMKTLQAHIGDENSGVAPIGSRKEALTLTRHYIGRLGSHLRAAKIMAVAGRRMPDLFENLVVRRLPAPKPPCFPPPVDALTTLPSILKRMLPKDSEQLAFYREALEEMDAKFNITHRLHTLYEDKDFKPRIHAELNLLEWAHAGRLVFVDDDRFIACSKPACYCCYHYINQHPGRFVVPPCHGKRYVAWRPPDLNHPGNAAEMKNSVDMINAVIAQIRQDALCNIELRKGPSPWRPDSTTGITVSCGPLRSVHEADTRRASAVRGPMLSKPWTAQSALITEADHLHADLTEITSTFEVQADLNERPLTWSEEDSDSDGGVFIGDSYTTT